MKAILEFNLPEDHEALHAAQCGQKHTTFIWTFQEFLRQQEKYAPVQETTWAAVREQWYQHLHDAKIDLQA